MSRWHRSLLAVVGLALVFFAGCGSSRPAGDDGGADAGPCAEYCAADAGQCDGGQRVAVRVETNGAFACKCYCIA